MSIEQKTGQEYLAEFKKTLQKQNGDSLAWAAMSHGDKALLIRSAKLDKQLINSDGFIDATWGKLHAVDKQKLREAAKRAASWANSLEII